MLKIILLFVVLGASVVLHAEDDFLLNKDFKEGLKHWGNKKKIALPVEKLGFKVENIDGENCLVAIGTADFKDNPQKQLAQTIKSLEQPLKHVVVFKMSINPIKVSGSLNFMIREANAKGKTIRYRKITINKWAKKGWKEYTANFVAMSPTVFLQIYIQSQYLQPGDKVLLKDLKLEIHKKDK